MRRALGPEEGGPRVRGPRVHGARAGRFAGALLAAALAVAACSEPQAVRPRNLVLVVVDTLRADHTGFGGYARPTTPFLDRFARERGQVFEWARSAAPWTKPSMASVWTGLDPRHHQVTLHPHRLHSTLSTLAEVLRERGFQTAGVQSNMLLVSAFGFEQGFERYVEGLEQIAGHDHSTGEAINRAAIDWMERERDPARPFFLYVHHYEPHHQYLRSGEAYYPDYRGPLTGAETMDDLVGAADRLSAEDAAFLAARYDAEIAYQDQLLEELFGALERGGLLEDTLVVLTSDHGEEFLEHGDLSHQYKLYDELLRVPLLFALPHDPRAGARIPGAVNLIDLGRTLLDLLGLSDAEFPGRSFAASLAGSPVEAGDQMAHAEVLPAGEETPRALDMLLSGRHKLIRHLGSGARELYDLEADPGEQRDLAAAEPERVAELERRLEQHLESRRALERPLAEEPVHIGPEMLELMQKAGYLGVR